MAAGVVKVTVLTILACSSWLSHGSLDTSPDVSTCVGNGECASKSGDAWLQTKKTDTGRSGEMWLASGPVMIDVGRGLCQEMRLDLVEFSYGAGYNSYYYYAAVKYFHAVKENFLPSVEKYKPAEIFISPPSEEFAISKEDCFEKAKDTGALGFAISRAPAKYIPDPPATMLLPNFAGKPIENYYCNLYGYSCGRRRREKVHEYCHIYYQENKAGIGGKEGAVKRYGFPKIQQPMWRETNVSGPYKIDTSSCGGTHYQKYYAYSDCFRIEYGDYYKLTAGISTCDKVDGYEYIPSEEECKKAAGTLGLNLEVRVRSDKRDPKGCFLIGTKEKFNPGALRWNDDGRLSFLPRPKRNVICKRSD